MDEDWRLEYDARQYRSMAGQLRQFEEGTLDLASLIGGLEALLNLLEAADESWKDDFRSEWGTLEVVHAVALDRVEQKVAPYEATINDPANRAAVNDAVRKIRALVQRRIGTSAPEDDEFDEHLNAE